VGAASYLAKRKRILEVVMAERAVVLDEPVMDEQGVALRNAVERAERAEAELAKMKAGGVGVSGGAAVAGSVGEESDEAKAARKPELRGMEALREDSMMRHLLEALGEGKDIGHYGRLTFAMVARHFLTHEEMLAELGKDRDFSEEKAELMLRQVEERDYSPPRRERILEWQRAQAFPILPEPHDPDCGNVYRSLRFEGATYKHIEEYQEEKMMAEG
jgi:hypothetical protein